jgi:hypothetical protein
MATKKWSKFGHWINGGNWTSFDRMTNNFQMTMEKNWMTIDLFFSPNNGWKKIMNDQKPSDERILITKKLSMFELMDKIDMSWWILTTNAKWGHYVIFNNPKALVIIVFNIWAKCALAQMKKVENLFTCITIELYGNGKKTFLSHM